MGRRAQGHTIKWKRGWAYVHFTHAAHTYRLALCTRDPQEAAARGAHEHAAVVAGRRQQVVASRVAGALQPLDVLLAEWIAAQEGSLDELTLKTLETYARHYIGFFKSLDRMTDATCADYGRSRLRCVIRKTAQKECSYLRGFLAWCKEQGALGEIPMVPPLPKKATGTRSGKQRSKPVEITEEQGLAIIAHLPVVSKTIDGRKWPIQDRFLVSWETALRPGTIENLSAPEHYQKGSTELVIDDPDDKARFGRTLPLSARARAALDRCVPEGGGLLFGRHLFWKVLKHAAAKVLPADQAKRFAAYDFRHGRGTQLADEGASLTGIAYLMGHKQLTTTNRYLKPSRRAAERALAIGAPLPHPGASGILKESAKSAESLGDRRGSNPRHLEPQRTHSVVIIDVSAKRERQNSPSNPEAGPDKRTGCGNAITWADRQRAAFREQSAAWFRRVAA
jgi:integrase